MEAIENQATVFIADPKINYYFRRRLYQHCYTFCESKLRKTVGDANLLFWKSIAMIYLDNAPESIRDLATLQDRRDYNLVVPIAMLFAHKNCKFMGKINLRRSRSY
jgi:hypothetical protein